MKALVAEKNDLYRSLEEKRDVAACGESFHVSAHGLRPEDVAYGRKQAQGGENFDVFHAEMAFECTWAFDQGDETVEIGVEVFDVIGGAGEIFGEVADDGGFAFSVIVNGALAGKFRKAKAGSPGHDEMVVVVAHGLQPLADFGADNGIELLVGEAVDVAHDVEAFAHGATIVFDEDGNHFFADKADRSGFVIVGEDDVFKADAAQAKDHAGLDAVRAMIVSVEFHGLSLACV